MKITFSSFLICQGFHEEKRNHIHFHLISISELIFKHVGEFDIVSVQSFDSAQISNVYSYNNQLKKISHHARILYTTLQSPRHYHRCHPAFEFYKHHISFDSRISCLALRLVIIIALDTLTLRLSTSTIYLLIQTLDL